MTSNEELPLYHLAVEGESLDEVLLKMLPEIKKVAKVKTINNRLCVELLFSVSPEKAKELIG